MGVTGTRLDLWSTQEAWVSCNGRHNKYSFNSNTKQGHNPGMLHINHVTPSCQIWPVPTGSSKQEHTPVHSQTLHIKTRVKCMQEKICTWPCRHYWQYANLIWIQHSHVQIILANNLPCIHHIKCSRCLPWACRNIGCTPKVWNVYLPFISYFKKYLNYHIKQK
jgi:hypothetical protein